MQRIIRSTLLFILIGSVLLFPASGLMLAFLVVFVCSMFLKRSLRRIVEKLRPAIFLGAVALLVYTLTADLYTGLSVALKLILVFWLAQMIVEEVPLQRFIGGMAQWKAFNQLFRRLSLMLLVAAVSFPIINKEAKNIYDAHVSRGVDFRKGNVSEKVNSLFYFLNILFVKIFDRVDALTYAMESRIPSVA